MGTVTKGFDARLMFDFRARCAQP